MGTPTYEFPFDFIAELKYWTEKEGGRKAPANSCYRPNLEFYFTKMLGTIKNTI
jgi:translation elongation factor EF-Tu-like GTPase